MFEKVFWNVFQKTGNIEAYLASKECTNCSFHTESSEELFPQIRNNKDEKKMKKDD
mgnify:CR=1 FL=1